MLSYFTFVFFVLSRWNSGVFCTCNTRTIQLKLAAFQILKLNMDSAAFKIPDPWFVGTRWDCKG